VQKLSRVGVGMVERRPFGDLCKNGTGILGQRVEVYVIDAYPNEITKK